MMPLLRAVLLRLYHDPKNIIIMHSMWLYKHKTMHILYSQIQVVFSCKREVSGGIHRLYIDYQPRYKAVITVLHTALVNDWPIKHLAVQNAFFHGTLEEEVYMFQPSGFVYKEKPNHVCRLKRSIYGLK